MDMHAGDNLCSGTADVIFLIVQVMQYGRLLDLYNPVLLASEVFHIIKREAPVIR